MKKIITLLLAAIALSGCATYKLQEAQTDLRSSFATHNFNKTVSLLERYDRKDIYRSKDQVLYNLEMGTAMHFDGKYEASTHYFTKAEDEIDQLFSKSVSRGIGSFLVGNDNMLAYNGEAYEDVYLNAFKSLNFIQQNNLEGALVEARRISHKLSQIESKYKGVARALSKADTLQKGTWETGEQSIQDSPLARYLSSVLYAKSGKPDDARIEYQKLMQVIENLPAHYPISVDKHALQRIKQPESYNVLVVGFTGRAPQKYQNDTRLYLDNEDLYLKFSLPALRLYQSRVAGVKAVINDSLNVPLQLIERMDLVAKEVYKVKEPIIYARTFVRSFTKAVGTNAAGRAIEEENEGLGLLVNILGKVGQEFTEQADTRSWQTMPGQAYVSTLKLPPGEHKIAIEYYSKRGNLLFTRNSTLTVAPGDNLKVLESLYWN